MVWQSSTNEDTAFPWWYDEGTPLSRTCQFSEMGRGSTQEPPCRLFEQFNFSALLSQSGITFDQFRLVQLHQNLPQSKDVESILRTEVHVGSTNFPVRFYWIVFCTWDAFHNRNSQWCFWASVSFLLRTSNWQEPFGESLSRLTFDNKTMSEFTLLK